MNQVLKIIRTTYFKREPKQASDLPPESIVQIPEGKEFELHSYAYADSEGDFGSHVRIALKNPADLIRGFNTWYVHGRHVEIEVDGEHVYPQEEEASHLVLEIDQDTLLKRQPVDESELQDNQKVAVKQETTFALHSYAFRDGQGTFNGHIRFAIADPDDYVNGFSTWYVLERDAHVELNDEVVYPPAKIHDGDRPEPSTPQPAAGGAVAPKPGGTTEAAAKPGVPAAAKPGMSTPVAGKPGTPAPAAGKPGATPPAAGKPGTPAPAAGKPGATPPAAGKSSTPAAAKPAAGKPGTTTTAIAAPPVLPRYSAKNIRLPDGRTVSTSDPIIPNGSFTWGHATHGGVRIPQSTVHMQNMVKLATEMEKLRKQFASRQIRVTSWYRPEPWNSRVGGARRSQHLTGNAIDITIPGLKGREVGNAVLSWWKGGLGIYPGNRTHILHLDIGSKRKWGF